ncbi:MAG TPA: hypothetical protein VF383_05495, partial [Candidatus Dormibacteraeota bacterium]
MSSGFVLASRPVGSIFTAQHTKVATNAQAAVEAAPLPANFDRFEFSNLWLAINKQPSLPIHGQAAYLVDLDAREVLWARDPETS